MVTHGSDWILNLLIWSAVVWTLGFSEHQLLRFSRFDRVVPFRMERVTGDGKRGHFGVGVDRFVPILNGATALIGFGVVVVLSLLWPRYW